MDFHHSNIIHVNRITLNVKSLQKQKRFYHSILGMPIKHETPIQIIFAIGDWGDELVLNLLENGRNAESSEAGLFHLALLLDREEQLGAFIKHMSSHNIPIGGGDHLVSQAVYFTDFEGNGIEVYVDRPFNKWEWVDDMVKMDTLPLNVEDILHHAEGAIWGGMRTGARIGHLHLKAANLTEAQQFYENVGFQLVSTFPKALFMSDSHYHHHLALNNWKSHNKRIHSNETYGLTSFNIVKPDATEVALTTPEGIVMTINSALKTNAETT
ncbi:VOC family protein [Staphylococcus agnetis]|uniref:VOC family protein n=1 Tax=Staphylococcus agnetis TaxID=985762 RepID=A0ABD7TVD5_9STAP|nr:VOC family protein [Staphylococcus agnetis]UXU54554.1 VOC family protein [Staphylococcus agnetis]UXU56792.1 VOC family protein [Staphylococcus agnetis]